jgi:hypothetical protein
MQQQQQRGMLEDLKATSNWIAWICQVMSVTVECFLHDQFGERYMGAQAALAIPLILIFSLFFPASDVLPLFRFLEAYLLVSFLIRIETSIRRRRGTLPAHTRYNGRPFLARLLPRVNEVTIKRFLEPLLVFVVGCCTMPHSQSLGTYLIVAAIALAGSVNMWTAQQRVQAMDMNDAVISQTEIAERFREMNRS